MAAAYRNKVFGAVLVWIPVLCTKKWNTAGLS